MHTIAIYSIKGGVGKTATAVNLAYECANNGHLSLLWDIDPQGATTFYLRVLSTKKIKIRKLLKGNRSPLSEIKGTEFMKLDILPADLSYRNLDIILDDMKKSRHRLAELCQELHGEYNYLFIDTPPSINLLAENIFQAAEILLVPVIPTVLSLRTLDHLIGFFQQEKLDTKRIVPFFSLVDRRKRLHRDILEKSDNNRYGFLQTYIPYSAEIEQMGQEQNPVGFYKPKSPGALAFRQLWIEVQNRLSAKK